MDLRLCGPLPPGLTDQLRRYGLGLLCLALVLGFALLHAVAPHAYVWLSRLPDGVAKPHPFIDLRAILQGGACWRRGVDVYAPSACLGGGVFNYSPLLLRLAWLPLGPRDALAGGLLFCAAYGAALLLLPAPARGWRFVLLAGAAFSPAAYYALEQGNLDAPIFAATVLALRLPWRLRGLSYALFAAGAAAKFYPAALFSLALRENRRTLAVLTGLGLAVSGLVLALYGPALLAAISIIPSGTPFRASFGRIDLFRGLAWLHRLPPGTAAAWSWGMALAALAVALPRRRGWSAALTTLPATEARFLIAGAAIIVFCFMAAQNIEYRAIFLLLTLPGLLRLDKHGWSFRLLPWSVTLLLWEAVPRALLAGLRQPTLPPPALLGFWLLREVLWWWLTAELLAASLAFVTQEFQRLRHEKLTPRGITHK